MNKEELENLSLRIKLSTSILKSIESAFSKIKEQNLEITAEDIADLHQLVDIANAIYETPKTR